MSSSLRSAVSLPAILAASSGFPAASSVGEKGYEASPRTSGMYRSARYSPLVSSISSRKKRRWKGLFR